MVFFVNFDRFVFELYSKQLHQSQTNFWIKKYFRWWQQRLRTAQAKALGVYAHCRHHRTNNTSIKTIVENHVRICHFKLHEQYLRLYAIRIFTK